MTLLEELEGAVQAAAERSGPAVVGLGRGWGVGSGVVIAPGRVLTNAHNLRHDETTVTFHDGRDETGRVAGSDSDLDVAVIEVDTGDIEPIEWPSEPEEPSDRAARSSPWATRADAVCASRPGSSRRPRGASAALAAGGSRARSSTPRRCRADRSGGPLLDAAAAGCSASTRSASTAA